jgi:hypothetical protein
MSYGVAGQEKSVNRDEWRREMTWRYMTELGNIYSI